MQPERYRLTELSLRILENENGRINRIPLGNSTNYFACILSGHAILRSRGAELRLGPGELLYIPKGLPYVSEWYGSPCCRFYSLSFCFGHFSENSRFPLEKRGEAELGLSAGGLRALFDELSAAEQELTALSLFYRLYGIAAAHLTVGHRADGYAEIAPALRVMEDDPAGSYDIPSLARLSGVSESKFYTTFRRVTGYTPIEYKNVLRCRVAMELLGSTDLTLEQIAERLACSTPSYLRRMLKRTVGKTPRELRLEQPSL